MRPVGRRLAWSYIRIPRSPRGPDAGPSQAPRARRRRQAGRMQAILGDVAAMAAICSAARSISVRYDATVGCVTRRRRRAGGLGMASRRPWPRSGADDPIRAGTCRTDHGHRRPTADATDRQRRPAGAAARLRGAGRRTRRVARTAACAGPRRPATCWAVRSTPERCEASARGATLARSTRPVGTSRAAEAVAPPRYRSRRACRARRSARSRRQCRCRRAGARRSRPCLACLDSVLAESGEAQPLIVVDDASPEPELVARWTRWRGRGGISCSATAATCGFAASANAGHARRRRARRGPAEQRHAGCPRLAGGPARGRLRRTRTSAPSRRCPTTRPS